MEAGKITAARGALRKITLMFGVLVLLGGAVSVATSTAAFAGNETAPGCDDALWDAQKTRADAMRVRDAAYARIAKQPDSALATTCFDVALALSARLGGVFADLAGGFQFDALLPPLSAWGRITAEASATFIAGPASPAFFPPNTMPPPLGSLIQGVMGAIDFQKSGKMKLYNPFGNLSGFRLDHKGNFDVNSLMHIYWKSFEVDLNNYLPNFKGSIGGKLGINVATSLSDLVARLSLRIPTIPRFDLPQYDLPSIGLSLSLELCGSISTASLGFDLGPLATVVTAVSKILKKANDLFDAINKFIEKVNTLMTVSVSIMTNLKAATNILASAQASLAGIDWPSFSLPLPWLAPGCLYTMGVWAGRQYDKAGNYVKKAKGVTGGLSDKLADNPSMSDLPYFTYAEMAEKKIKGAGPELMGMANGQVNPDGSISVTGELQTQASIDIIAQVNLDLEQKLESPETSLIDTWKNPPQVTGSTSVCGVLMKMPGAMKSGPCGTYQPAKATKKLVPGWPAVKKLIKKP